MRVLSLMPIRPLWPKLEVAYVLFSSMLTFQQVSFTKYLLFLEYSCLHIFSWLPPH